MSSTRQASPRWSNHEVKLPLYGEMLSHRCDGHIDYLHLPRPMRLVLLAHYEESEEGELMVVLISPFFQLFLQSPNLIPLFPDFVSIVLFFQLVF